jgi:hypothetical protein
MTPWRVLCVDLIGPYNLKGKDGSSIDFMCLTTINPTTSWFKIVELSKKVTCAKNTKVTDTTHDKSSAQISNLVYKQLLSRYPHC